MSIEIVNLTQVNLDFQKYSKRVDLRNRKTIHKFGALIKNRMKWILRQKVITWTGNLAGSIRDDYSNNQVEVSANTPYANWIEEGGKGGFRGYHYTEESVDRYDQEYLDELQKNLEV